MSGGASRAIGSEPEHDSAGGSLITGSPDVFINGNPAVRVGDQVRPHGRRAHRGATMVSGSDTVFINGLPAVRAGDVASCGHTISGSDNVSIG
jgi:uncharacterized Zn-binding protein involved in type VI secretion